MATWLCSSQTTVARAGRRSNPHRSDSPAHASCLYISLILKTDPHTRFLHIETTPHDFHDPQSWHSPSMTNILFKPTLLVHIPFNFHCQTPPSNLPFRRFTLTESERDVEVMPGGSYDEADGLHSGELPFASAVSWGLHVRQI